jgi:hypothetical protein
MSLGTHAVDYPDLICRSILVGTGHLESLFLKPFS